MSLTGKDATLGYGDTAEGTFTALARVVELGDFNKSGEKISLSNQVMGDIDCAKTNLPGEWEVDDMPFTLDFDKAVISTLDGIFQTSKYWELDYGDGSTRVFKGFINSLGTPIPMKDWVRIKGTLVIEDEGTYTPATDPEE
jgi:hypothetical protein